MKKDIAKVLSSCTEDELDSLLKDNVNVPLDSNIKERIKKSVFEKTGIKQKKKNTKLRRAVIVAAALVAALSVVLGIYAYADAKEYNEAVEFFAETGYSVSGMTRADIKTLYRQIKKSAVSYSENGRSTASETENGVMGTDLSGYDVVVKSEKAGRTFYLYSMDAAVFLFGKGKSRFTMYENGKLAFTYVTDKIMINNYNVISDGIILSGNLLYIENNAPVHYGSVLKLDFNGKLLWHLDFSEENGFDSKVMSGYAIENADKTLSLFCTRFEIQKDENGEIIRDYKDAPIYNFYVVSVEISKDGKLLGTRENQIPHQLDIQLVIKFDGGYLAKVNSSGTQTFVKFAEDLTMTDKIVYSESGYKYFINDMCEYKGKLYLSVDRMKTGYDSYVGEKHTNTEKGAIMFSHIFEGVDESDLPLYALTGPDKLYVTNEVFGCTSAMLLVCDTLEWNPAEFYSVDGAFSGELTVTDGRLVWNTNNIYSVTGKYEGYVTLKFGKKFLYSIVCDCVEYQYIFDGADTPVAKLKTDTQNKLCF